MPAARSVSILVLLDVACTSATVIGCPRV